MEAKKGLKSIKIKSVEANLEVNKIFKKKTNLEKTLYLLQKIKSNSQDVLKCLKLGFSSLRVETWAQFYRALALSFVQMNSNKMNGIDFAFSKKINQKLEDKVALMKRGMKVCLYEEVRYFIGSYSEKL